MVEMLSAFICLSNNNDTKISNSYMVEKLLIACGHKLGHYKNQDYFSFPTLEALAVEGVEQALHSLGFGYPAGYVYKTVTLLVNGMLKCCWSLYMIYRIQNPNFPYWS